MCGTPGFMNELLQKALQESKCIVYLNLWEADIYSIKTIAGFLKIEDIEKLDKIRHMILL